MRSSHIVNLSIPFAPEYVQLARQTLEELARSLSFQPCEIEDMKTAVGEACTNAVRHGCRRPGMPCVSVRYILQARQLTVEVRNGKLPHLTPAIPADCPHPGDEGGYGLFIIRRLMDRVRVSHSPHAAIVTMTKRLRS